MEYIMVALCYKTNCYATHQPFLIELLKRTTGNILELGCGEGSTLLMKNAIKGTDRKLVTVESNKEWFEKYKHLADENHSMLFLDAENDDTIEVGEKWVEFLKTLEYEFEVVFIDQSPWTARLTSMKYYIERSKYVIIHDADYFPTHKIFGNIDNIVYNSKGYKLQCNFNDVAPNSYLFYPPEKYFLYETGIPTLVLSKTATPDEFLGMIQGVLSSLMPYYD